MSRTLPRSPLRDNIGKRNRDARQASLFRHCAIASFLTSPSISTSASSVGLKRSKKTGVWHKCHSLFSCLALCLVLRSVPISGNEIVTLGKPRYSVTALSLRSLRLSAKRQLSRSCYQFIIDVSTVKRSPSTNASSVGLKRSTKTGVWHKCHSLLFLHQIR